MGEDKSSWRFYSLGIQKCCPDDTQLCMFYDCSVMNTHSLTKNHISNNSGNKVTQHPVTIFGILSFGWIGTLKPMCIWAQSLLQHWFQSMGHTQTICWIVYLLHVIWTLVPWEIARPESMLFANECEWTVAFNHLWALSPSWVPSNGKIGSLLLVLMNKKSMPLWIANNTSEDASNENFIHFWNSSLPV